MQPVHPHSVPAVEEPGISERVARASSSQLQCRHDGVSFAHPATAFARANYSRPSAASAVVRPESGRSRDFRGTVAVAHQSHATMNGDHTLVLTFQEHT